MTVALMDSKKLLAKHTELLFVDKMPAPLFSPSSYCKLGYD